MKPTRFLLSENPMKKGSPEYILHTITPKFLGVIREYTDELAKEIREKKGSQFHSLIKPFDEVEYIITIIDFYEDLEPTQENADKIARALSKAGDWFFSYLIFEDNQNNLD